RLPLPPALPVRRGALPDRGAGAAHARGSPFRPLPPRRRTRARGRAWRRRAAPAGGRRGIGGPLTMQHQPDQRETMTRVFFEPEIPLHDPALYAFERLDAGVPAEIAGQPETLARYREDGFLTVRGLLPVAEVMAARAELEAMALSDDPACAMIWYEGALRAHLALDPARDRAIDGRVSGVGFAAGQESRRLPDLDPALRARFVRKFMGFVDRAPALGRLARHAALLGLIER